MDKSLIFALNFENLNEYYRKNYVIFKDKNQNLSAAICKVTNVNYIKQKYGEDIKFYIVEKKDIDLILERSFNEHNSYKAINHLSNISKTVTAKTLNYTKMTIGFVIIFTAAIFFMSNLFNFVNNIIYLSQNILKALLFAKSIEEDLKHNVPDLNFRKYSLKLPIYTIFIPLYKEVRKLKPILKAIEQLDYPKSKLDVKFIIESDDQETIKALSALRIPEYIQVIKVPFSLPRTKPKAMNYAIPYVKGEYLCVYDAEDIPDPDQLLKALHAFNNLPECYACVQAKLTFYNSNENILTKFFSIEYCLWFQYLLNGLSLYNLPMTLGGTSNHFKVNVLKEVGYWDPFNVTEDADLGIRLYSKGYKIDILDSNTQEEAPIALSNWITQRSRWIKGFIQTFYVFLKQKKDYKTLDLKKVISTYIFIGFSSYSFLCMPWLAMVFLFKLNKYIYYLWLLNTLFSLSYMYFSAYYIVKQKYYISTNYIIIIAWPIYFFLHSVSSYLALFEILTAPFKWNKTKHGVSSNELD